MKPEVFESLKAQCRMMRLPEPVPEFRFHPTRKWRFDAAFPEQKIAIEQEGVVYAKDGRLDGRHVRAQGFKNDIQKYGEAFALGWTVLRATPSMIQRTVVIEWLDRRLRCR